MTKRRITDDLEVLLGVLPEHISEAVAAVNDSDNLLEIILDLGRVPTARFLSGEVVLKDEEITQEEIDYVVEGIGEVDADNRAGLERTLELQVQIQALHPEAVGHQEFHIQPRALQPAGRGSRTGKGEAAMPSAFKAEARPRSWPAPGRSPSQREREGRPLPSSCSRR